MTHIARSALVPRSAQAMYDLVNDVESYPRRFDWCTSAEILERTPDMLVSRLAVHYHRMRTHFTTRNRLEPGVRIDMQFVSGPFASLHGVWTFQALGAVGCKIGLEMDFEMSGPLVGSVLAIGFRSLADRMVDDFVRAAMAEKVDSPGNNGVAGAQP